MRTPYTDKTSSAHHTVPKFYLKGFEDDNGHITLWDRLTGAIRRKATKYASTTKGYYTILDKNGDKTDLIENLYMKVENDTKPILGRMTCVFPQIPSFYSYDRMVFSQYLAMQFSRTKRTRRKSQLIYDYYRKVFALLKISHKRDILTKEQRLFLKEPHRFGEFFQSQDLLCAQEIDLANKIELFFRYRPWSIIVFSEPCLITSDTPIYIMPDTDLMDMGIPGNGLATAAELWFPLDSKHLLVMGRPLCSYPLHKDNVIYPNNTPLSRYIFESIYQASNNAQITCCYMEAYGQRTLLEHYAGKPLSKVSPFIISKDDSILSTYYNGANIDLEPKVRHGNLINDALKDLAK